MRFAFDKMTLRCQNFATTGMIRSAPKARGETRKIGATC